MMIHYFTGVLYIYRSVGPEIFERLRLAMQCDDGMYCGDCSVELGTRLGDGCVQM